MGCYRIVLRPAVAAHNTTFTASISLATTVIQNDGGLPNRHPWPILLSVGRTIMNNLVKSETFTTSWMNAGQRCSTVQDALNIATRASRFDQVILSVFVNSTSELPHMWCTLSGEWLSYYLRRSFYSCDAVAQAGATRSKPFFWSDLKVEGTAREFMEESALHGIGPSGYSIPLVGPEGQRTLLSISSSSMSDKDWRYYIRATGKELQVFAKFLRSRA